MMVEWLGPCLINCSQGSKSGIRMCSGLHAKSMDMNRLSCLWKPCIGANRK